MFRRSKTSDNPARQPTRNVTPRDRQTVFSYRAVRQVRDGDADRQLESLQQRQRLSRTAARRKARAIAVLVVLAACFIYVTWLNGSPQVTVLGAATERSLLQNTAIYQQAAAKLLSDSLANHNKLTLDASGIATKLEQAYPELATVSVQSSLFGHQPHIFVAPAEPTLELVTTSGTTFVLATSGKALAPASTVAGLAALHLPVVTDQSGIAVSTGSSALPSSDVAFIEAVLQQFNAQHITTTSLTLPQGTSELDVRITGKAYFIKFNLEGSVNPQIGTYLAVNKYLTGKNVTPTQYVDVRVPGRSYYI